MMARYNDQPPAPKPYGFVPIQRLEEGDRKDPAAVGHESYKPGTVSGTLRGEIIALSPVHVGSGTLEMQNVPEAPLFKAHVRSGGRAVIPGSSLKGLVRSIVEAISPSCVHISQALNEALPRGTQRCSRKNSLCVACRMFGATGRGWGYQGRLRFTDAFLSNGGRTVLLVAPSLYAPGSKSEIPYYEGGTIKKKGKKLIVAGGQVKGRKFYMHGQPAQGDVPLEVCPPDSVFNLTLHFDNLERAELGLLLVALGLGDPPLVLKLGAAKPVCYGSVKIRLDDLKVFEEAAAVYADYDSVQSTTAEPAPYLEAARQLIQADSLKTLAELLKVDTDRNCPEGNY
jgi:CRISPR/Cas system CSM-associated protein Csm3 (group 7 of RAMP superfamily)